MHLSDKFDWGYQGKASQQTSLAILIEYFKESKRVLLNYKKFEEDIISKIPTNMDFIIYFSTIDKWYNSIEIDKDNSNRDKNGLHRFLREVFIKKEVDICSLIKEK